MRLVFGEDARVADFVHSQIPHMPTGFGSCVAIGVEKNEVLIAGVVFHDYRGNDIQISCASIDKRWLTRYVIESVFRYPFVQLKCDRLTSMTPKSNVSTRKFLAGLGFKEEGNIRRGFLRDDCIVYGMLHEECRWIESNHHG